MNNELISAIEALEKEAGINKDTMFDTIEKALFEEYRAQYKNAENCRVVLDRTTGEFHLFADRVVVEDSETGSEEENDGTVIGLSLIHI